MSVKDLYSKVTNQIIADIEKGDLPIWLKPWKTQRRGGIMPVNAVTGRFYSGLNVLVLWLEREEKGYEQNLWLTYKQCQEAGGQVRKGERSTPGIYVNKTLKDAGTAVERLVSFVRQFSLFNVAQCDGLPQNEPAPDLPEHERNARVEAFLKATGADIRHGGDRAYYNQTHDHVQLPELGTFIGPDQYYCVAFHELAHWTGASTRLDRFPPGLVMRAEYAFEELVAELTSAYLCAHYEVKAEMRHAPYLSHYLKMIKYDDTAFFRAAAAAQRATDYLRAFSDPQEEAE